MTDPSLKTAARRTFRRAAETLAVAVAGGLALGLPGFPAGWLSGSIIAVSVAALAGRPVLVPGLLARATYIVMGTSLGATVTPETVAGMATWPLSLALLAISMGILTVVVMVYLQVVHKWDAGSALLAAFPGALATVLVLAVENKANVRGVAVVQTVRVVAVAVLLPAALALTGLHSAPMLAKAPPFSQPLQLFALVAVSTAAAVGAQWIKLPGGLIFGAMISSALLHGTGWVTVTLPTPLTIASFIVLGAATGARFGNMDVRTLRHLAAAASGALVVGVGTAFGCAALAATLLSLDKGPMVIAYAPGAIEAMMVLALALHYDAAFVGAHHLARFMLVLLTMPMIVSFMRRMRAGKDDGPPHTE